MIQTLVRSCNKINGKLEAQCNLHNLFRRLKCIYVECRFVRVFDMKPTSTSGNSVVAKATEAILSLGLHFCPNQSSIITACWRTSNIVINGSIFPIRISPCLFSVWLSLDLSLLRIKSVDNNKVKYNNQVILNVVYASNFTNFIVTGQSNIRPYLRMFCWFCLSRTEENFSCNKKASSIYFISYEKTVVNTLVIGGAKSAISNYTFV